MTSLLMHKLRFFEKRICQTTSLQCSVYRALMCATGSASVLHRHETLAEPVAHNPSIHHCQSTRLKVRQAIRTPALSRQIHTQRIGVHFAVSVVRTLSRICKNTVRLWNRRSMPLFSKCGECCFSKKICGVFKNSGHV